jgi:hypothetical protein
MFVASGPIEVVASHHTAATARLGKGDRSQRHCLLVMSSQCRQALPLRVQRLAQSGNIAMTEDRENAREQKIFAAVDFARLRCEEADERLGHCEPDCGHFPVPQKQRVTAKSAEDASRKASRASLAISAATS